MYLRNYIVPRARNINNKILLIMKAIANPLSLTGFLLILFVGAGILENEILNAVIAVVGLGLMFFGIYQNRSKLGKKETS